MVPVVVDINNVVDADLSPTPVIMVRTHFAGYHSALPSFETCCEIDVTALLNPAGQTRSNELSHDLVARHTRGNLRRASCGLSRKS
jgi:hypothetical protein